MIARAAAATVTIVALAGCGSSTLSARALRTQASRVCITAVRRSDRIALPRSNAGGTAFLARGIAVFGPELEALRKLAPPPSLEGELTAINARDRDAWNAIGVPACSNLTPPLGGAERSG